MKFLLLRVDCLAGEMKDVELGLHTAHTDAAGLPDLLDGLPASFGMFLRAETVLDWAGKAAPGDVLLVNAETDDDPPTEGLALVALPEVVDHRAAKVALLVEMRTTLYTTREVARPAPEKKKPKKKKRR